MRYFLIYSLQLVLVAAYAQTGHFFLTNHSPSDKGIDHVSFDMVQNSNGVLNFATRSGVLTYDGKNWEHISCGGAVYAIEVNEANEIFWAGANGFGRIIQKKSGHVVSELLSDSTCRDVYQAVALGDKVFFMNDDAIFILEGKSLKTISVDKNVSGSFTLLFEIFNVPFVGASQGQFFEINQLKLKEPNIDFNSDIIFSCRMKDQYLIGTSDNRLFLCTRDLSIHEVRIEERDYLNASVIINGVWVNDNIVALGTLRGGVIFLNLDNGSIEEIINYNTGLPDNEVLSLLVDKNKNVWVSHEYGFTRIAPFVPFRSYSRYDNLKGNLLCATSINDEVYVGTSLGLFKLSKEEIYDEIIYYEDVPVKRILLPEKNQVNENKVTPISPVTPSTAVKPSTDGSEKKRNGFLKFLRRNRSKIEENSHDTINEVPVTKQAITTLDFKSQLPREEIVIQRLKKTEKVLRSAQFAYKKVNGIEAKVNNIAIANGKLIAAGVDGVFEVNDLSTRNILEEPVRFLFLISDTLLIASTYTDRVHTLVERNKEWVHTNDLKDIEDQISFVFEGNDGELWLSGMENIYRMERSGVASSILTLPFHNQNFSKTVGLYLGNEPMFVNANGFYKLNRQKNSIAKIDSLPVPGTYFASTEALWYHDGHAWNVFGETMLNSNIQMLNLCGDIRFIAPDQRPENLWLITRENELFKFFGDSNTFNSVPFKLFFKTILQSGATLKGEKRLIINQDDGPLEVEVVQANFTGGPPLEYRYILNGMEEIWSEWSSRNDRISFTYLLPGNYTLRVQSRDMFGTISEVDPAQFQVQPPYWKTPWFYAMEFTIFALLVLLSFKLSVRYRFISRVLSLLTIILLIEFIQTIIGVSFFTSSSPIIDFLIQVIVALIILPVEGFLRNLMFKSMGSNSRLFEVIAELDRQQKNKK